MAYRTDQVLSLPLLGTEVTLALSSSTISTHIDFRKSLRPLPIVPSNQYYAFFIRSHIGAPCTLSNLSAAASVIWDTVASTWSCDPALQRKVKHNIPRIFNNKNLRTTLEKHLEVQDIIQAVSFSNQKTTQRNIGNLYLLFSQALVLGYTEVDQCAMSYNHFLAYADTLRSRVHLIIAAIVEDIMGKYTRSQENIITHYLATIDAATEALSHADYFNSVKAIYAYAPIKHVQHVKHVVCKNRIK